MTRKSNKWNYGQFTVTTTPQLVLAGGEFREGVLVKNMHATATIYIGKDNTVEAVDITKAYPLEAKESIILNNIQPIWAMVAASTANLAFSEDTN